MGFFGFSFNSINLQTKNGERTTSGSGKQKKKSKYQIKLQSRPLTAIASTVVALTAATSTES